MHQQLDQAVVRRFRSHVARLQPQFDRVASRFFDRLGRDCPQALAMIPAWTKRNRYEVAGMFSDIVKHIDAPGTRLGPLQRAFDSVNLTEQDFKIMQKSLLHELRDAAGAEWSNEQQADWAAVLQSVFSQLHAKTATHFRAAA